jgi:hypothetical protein
MIKFPRLPFQFTASLPASLEASPEEANLLASLDFASGVNEEANFEQYYHMARHNINITLFLLHNKKITQLVDHNLSNT